MDPEFRRASTGRNMPAVEQTIIEYVCERGPHDPPTFRELADIAPTEGGLLRTLRRMIKSGAIETMHDDERGTVYVRNC